MTPIITRFAPSPTGLIHLGSAYAALFAWERAREAGGRFLLRIEDTDRARCRAEFVDALFEDLAWLGVDWDGEVRRQSEHLLEYQAVLDRLGAEGLLYPCFCTRASVQAEIAASAGAPQGPEGPLYPGTCRILSEAERRARIAAGESHALRLDAAEAAQRAGALTFEDHDAGRVVVDPLLNGDIVMARKDGGPSYHLAVTHDDAAQGVTLVTRARDLFPATHVQRVLQALLGYEAPRYWHHKLLTNAAGSRLAKRDQALSIRALRAAGRSPERVRAMAMS